MAGMREMALGIATTLRSGIAPNPLPVELWGYAPEDAARFVEFVIVSTNLRASRQAQSRLPPRGPLRSWASDTVPNLTQ